MKLANLGETILAMEPYFDNLYTIELSDYHYNISKSKYNGSKIKFIFGDSSVQLQSLLSLIDDKCVFFLDGHWSNGNTAR